MIDCNVYDYCDPYEMQPQEALRHLLKRATILIRDLASDMTKDGDSIVRPTEGMDAAMDFWAMKSAINVVQEFLTERRSRSRQAFGEALYCMETYVHCAEDEICDDLLYFQRPDFKKDDVTQVG